MTRGRLKSRTSVIHNVRQNEIVALRLFRESCILMFLILIVIFQSRYEEIS